MAAEAVLAIIAVIAVVGLFLFVAAIRLVPATLRDESNGEDADPDDGSRAGRV